MWFWLSLIALICWSAADVFTKSGTQPNDGYSHLKMACAVGLIMGLHAAYEIFIGGTAVTLSDIFVYLPASLSYIASMLIGYAALRYIELSVCSPVCNSSGAIAALLCLIFLGQPIDNLGIIAIAFVGVGVFMLSVVEYREDEILRADRQKAYNYKYSKSPIALLLPILYCIIDAAGTFFDSLILRNEDTGSRFDTLFPNVLSEETANVAYELTFLFIGIISAFYVFVIKKEKISVKYDGKKLVGGIFETAGQFAYIFAIGDTAHAAPAAAMISAYCVLSVVLSTVFLKEKLSVKHYIAIGITAVGIVMLGILDL